MSSLRPITSSYSMNSAVPIRGWYCPARQRFLTARLAPSSFRHAARSTLVSTTSATTV